MLLDALFAYLHYVSIFLTGAFLALEWVRCRVPMNAHRVRVIFRNDLGYFLSAMAALASGLLRAFYGARDSAFYFGNPVFLAKLGLFAAIALLSIPPTLHYLRWSRGFRDQAGYAVPEREVGRVRAFLLAEGILLAILPALAVLMARGFGA